MDAWVGEDVVDDVLEGAAGGFGAGSEKCHCFLIDACRGSVAGGQV